MVLVTFVFSTEAGKKLRPALVLSTAEYHRSRQEVIIAAITSNTQRRLIGDCPIAHWKTAGLLFPSTATGILRTVKREVLVRRLGDFDKSDLATFELGLRRSLGL